MGLVCSFGDGTIGGNLPEMVNLSSMKHLPLSGWVTAFLQQCGTTNFFYVRKRRS
jgi:hypothetical protein